MAKPPVSIEVIENVSTLLPKKEKNVEKGTIKGIKDATFFMVREVSMSILGQRTETRSIDTRQFLRSVKTAFRKGGEEGIVFSQVPYAKYLEFGTTKIAPRRHFRNSLNRNKVKIKTLIQNQIKV